MYTTLHFNMPHWLKKGSGELGIIVCIKYFAFLTAVMFHHHLYTKFCVKISDQFIRSKSCFKLLYRKCLLYHRYLWQCGYTALLINCTKFPQRHVIFLFRPPFRGAAGSRLDHSLWFYSSLIFISSSLTVCNWLDAWMMLIYVWSSLLKRAFHANHR